MTTTHSLGFPRIGPQRELKRAVEAYWRGDMLQDALLDEGRRIRRVNWQYQANAGMDFVAVGDFSWYDHVLDHAAMFGIVPERFGHEGATVDLDTYFRMARGSAPTGEDTTACEMTKWFDTNYHYMVPELSADERFPISTDWLFEQVGEALAAGYKAKPVLVGPVTFLWLSKAKGEEFDRLQLLDNLLVAYSEILARLNQQGVEWVQLDEPVLVTELPEEWQDALRTAYKRLNTLPVNVLLATYFGGLRKNQNLAMELPTAGLHIDTVRAPDQLYDLLDRWPAERVLSIGVVDGRNVWRNDLEKTLKRVEVAAETLGDRLWLAPSCSLLHTPVDLNQETELDAQLHSWLAFAAQKLDEIEILRQAVDKGRDAVAVALQESRRVAEERRTAETARRKDIRQRVDNADAAMARRPSAYADRVKAQHRRLDLPLLPTTTIGSFPQTPGIRKTRRAFRKGELPREQYVDRMQAEIRRAIREQEDIGLDMLVHGEPERNDMVEYFGEQFSGFAFTDHGWVQSYGSRCVKPPIIYGDVSRPTAITVDWLKYAQSLTEKPVKGMLTGPVTIIQWSFVRDDQPRADTCRQIALALRDEVVDLEAAGLKAIQVDEPALREGLPLRRKDWEQYLNWATECFRLATSGVKDETQIHTHMCYSEFNDIIDAVAALDADVVTIEAARSDMELLEAFAEFDYPNEIGPGVYDIHSPREPAADEMADQLAKAATVIPVDRLWVNPDCGLKTRKWEEVKPALSHMVEAARKLRRQFADKQEAANRYN